MVIQRLFTLSISHKRGMTHLSISCRKCKTNHKFRLSDNPETIIPIDELNKIVEKKTVCFCTYDLKPNCCPNCNESALEDDFIQRYNGKWLCKDCISDREII